MNAPRLGALILALFASQAAAQAGEGMGRVSLLPGWRYTPNTFFSGSAERAGHALERASPGGPQLTATFAYAATGSIEVAIDLFGGWETLRLADADALTSVTYGALAGFRAFGQWGPFVPNAGLALGPVLVFTSGGPGGGASERLVTGYAASGGISYPLSPSLSLTVDARVLLARGSVTGVGGINGGGVWAGVGLTWWIVSEAPRTVSVR